MLSHTRKKIFGIGFSKTGTNSLNKALTQLKRPAIHFPTDTATYNQILNQDFKLKILRHYDAITDSFTVPFYKQFDEEWPKSKFILTIRDIDNWLESIQELSSLISKMTGIYSLIFKMALGEDYSNETLKNIYNNHIEDVNKYFKARPNDLLIMNICEGDGWEKLCPFLGIETPKTKFPWDGKSKTSGKRINK